MEATKWLKPEVDPVFVDTRTFVFKKPTKAKARPPYTAEFRCQMVELVRAGRAPEELTQEFEPTAQSTQIWGVVQRWPLEWLLGSPAQLSESLSITELHRAGPLLLW
jgi:hypothetical protein